MVKDRNFVFDLLIGVRHVGSVMDLPSVGHNKGRDPSLNNSPLQIIDLFWNKGQPTIAFGQRGKLIGEKRKD